MIRKCIKGKIVNIKKKNIHERSNEKIMGSKIVLGRNKHASHRVHYVIYLVLSLWFMAITIASAEKEFTYKINFASNSINHWEIKNQVLETFDTVVYRVDKLYYDQVLKEGIQSFAITPNSQAAYHQNQITLTIGDGKGLVVEGTLENQCKIEIKRKSLLMKLLGK